MFGSSSSSLVGSDLPPSVIVLEILLNVAEVLPIGSVEEPSLLPSASAVVLVVPDTVPPSSGPLVSDDATAT